MKEKIKILIVEDEIIIAKDLKNILKAENYDVCGIAENYETALKLYKEEHPDIVLCDIYLKGNKTGIDFANKVNQLRYTSIIFITAFSSNDIINKLTDLKNISYITKPFTNSQVIAAVKLASYRIKKTLKLPDLTPRQEEVFLLIKDGVTENLAIAQSLNISAETVKNHKKILFQKFNVKNTTELIRVSMQY